MPFDDYLGDLVQLLAPLRWGYALCLLSIQPEPQGRGFELSFEIRDGLDRNADRSRDLLKVRVLVRSNFRAIRNHWNPTHREQRTAWFSLSITDLKGISFHRRDTRRKEILATPARLGLDKGEASELLH